MKYTDEYEFYSNLINDNNSIKSQELVKWNKDIELLVLRWCEISECYSTLCYKCYLLFRFYHYLSYLPIIILTVSVIILSLIQSVDKMFRDNVDVTLLIGVINLIIGLIIILQSFINFNDLRDNYKISHLSWDKLARVIRLELTKEINERMASKTFIQINKHEYERLIEMTPVINISIIINYSTKIEEDKVNIDVYNYILKSNGIKEKWYNEIQLLNLFFNFNDYEKEILKNIEKQEKKNHIDNTIGQIDMNNNYIENITKQIELQEILHDKIKNFKLELQNNRLKIENY
jgi:hypothetical protein